MNRPLKNARILLGVTGGIAAYKSAELCRCFIRAGAEVQAVMTDSAERFVAPLTFETLTHRPVYRDVFERNRAWEIEHVSFAQWADVFVVAPATANTIARLALGLADDALTTTALAFEGPLVLAPAMNSAMWRHPRTQEHLGRLRADGALIVDPGTGALACGDEGAGRLADLERIVQAVGRALASAGSRGALAGRSVLVTAGPTVEPIDPVRHLSNASSGRMGYALAEEAARRGANVTLVTGPTALELPRRVAEVVRVRKASEMHAAVMSRLDRQNCCVFAAAVADYTPEQPSDRKMKKEAGRDVLELRLVRTPDIAREAGERRQPGQVLVGFAAETDNVEANARDKMEAKGFDVVVANAVSAENPAFAAEDNAVLLLSRRGGSETLSRRPKAELAAPVWDFILKETELLEATAAGPDA